MLNKEQKAILLALNARNQEPIRGLARLYIISGLIARELKWKIVSNRLIRKGLEYLRRRFK